MTLFVEHSQENIRFSNLPSTDCYSRVVSSSSHTSMGIIHSIQLIWPYILAVPANGLWSVFVALGGA